MSTFEVAKLATDVLLGGSLIYFCIRFLKPLGADRHVRKIAELEGTIRGLIRDADDAGRSLNDELGRRQYALEKLLSDIKAVDGAVHKTLNDASEKATSIAKTIEQATSHRTAAAPARPVFVEPAPAKEAHWTTVEAEDVLEPPSFETISPSRTRRSTERTTLQSSIERQVFVPEPEEPQQQQEDLSDLEEVYRLAEDLLRAGKDMEFISSRTNLPVDQLQIIAESMARTQPSAKNSGPKDSRLGVLGNFIREERTV